MKFVCLPLMLALIVSAVAVGNSPVQKRSAQIKQSARKRTKAASIRSKSHRPRRKLSAEAIAELLEETRRKGKEEEREQIAGTGLRADQPGEAAEFFRQKRLPPGQQEEFSLDRYVTAQKQIEKMPRYASAEGRFVSNTTGQYSNEALPASWSWLGPGNVGGRTRALLIHPTTPDTMYAAGASGGVWKTTNAGATWAPISDLMANINVSVLAMDATNPQVIYAGTGEYYSSFRGAGIFKTTNGGATWTQLAATNNSDFHFIFDIVISPNNSQRIYASTEEGVFRSMDGGATWTRTFSSNNQTGVIGLPYDLAIRSDKPTDDLLLAFYEAYPNVRGQFLRNPDAGGSGTWTATLSEAGLSRAALAISPSNQNIVYAIGVSNDSASPYYNALHAFYKSSDGGQTWTATIRNTAAASINTSILSYLGGSCNPMYGFSGQGFYDLAIAVDPADENRVWVGGITWFRSDDGGKNFGVAAYGGNSYAHPDQHSIAFHPNYNGTTNQTMFIGNDGGVYRTNNARAAVVTDNTAMCNGTNPSVVWQPINNNYGVTQFYHGAVYPDGKTYFGGTQDNGTQRGSDASGANGWNFIRGGDGGYVAIDPTNTNVLYVENTQLSLVKSTDGGSSYTRATNGISGDDGFLFITPFTMDSRDPNRLWIGGSYLWRTADGAANWTRASTSVNGDTSAIAVAPTDSNYVVVGTTNGYIYRTTAGTTTDGNTSWLSARPRGDYVSGLTFDPVRKDTVYATYATFGGQHVWKSTNAGATWVAIDGSGNGALPDIPVHCLIVDPMNTQRLFIGTDLGIFVSLDGGASWAAENSGFANVIVESLELNINNGTMTLYAFTHGRGVYKVNIGVGCSYSFSSSSRAFAGSGGNGTVTVTSTPSTGCTWTATSNAPWVTVNSYDSTTVNYTVAANTGTTRSGTMTIGGKPYSITQYCTDLSTTSLNLPASGGTASINVTGSCAWTAASNASWMQITSGSSGNGNGTVNINIDVTNSTSPRTGTLTIAGNTVTVTQAGGTLDLELTRTNTGTLSPDSDSTYTLTVKNVGTATTNSTIQIAETLTNYGLYKGASGTNWVVTGFANGLLTMARSAALKPGESTSVAVTIRPSILAIPTLNVSGTVTLAGDGNAANNTSAHQFAVANPVPVISRVNPVLVSSGFGSFSLAVEGSMFTPNSKVLFNGVERATTYINIIRLDAQVLASDVQYGGVINVTVTAPGPGGGTSNVQTLTVNANTPFLTGHSPTAVTAGGAAFTLTVTGSWFNPNSVVRWNGADRPTTFASSTQLTAQIPASDIANAGTASITVFTPAPGGGTSATRTVTINAGAPAPAPSLTSISPASITVGSNEFTLTATGSNFMPNSVIRWNGANRTTTYVSATQLTAVIPTSDLLSSGTAQVTVFTPAPGGGTSAPLNFTLSTRAITTVSGASYAPIIGKDAIASAFGMEMATTTVAATSLPLPTTLGGTTVKVKDSAGVERLAPLFFVSPLQVNYQVPVGSTIGAATVTITSSDNKVTAGTLTISSTAPGIFSANANGSGLAAATVQRVNGNGVHTFEPITTYDTNQSKVVAIPIDLGPTTDQVFLNLYGTGIRFNTGLNKVTATVGGVSAQVLYAGAHCCFVGVDQLNILIPRSLLGRGTVDIVLSVEGQAANTVQINVK